MLNFLSKITKNSFKNSNTIGKFEGFLLLLILGAFYLLSEQYEYSQAIDKFSNHSFAKIESLQRENQVLIDLLLQNKIDKEQLCNVLIEDAEDLIKIAEGYHCLAKIEYNKKDDLSAYRAIKNISYALEANYKEEYRQDLFYFITGSYENVKKLEELANSADKKIKNRALYRMSLISSLGRDSSLEKKNYELEKSIAIKANILKELDINNYKKIDVLFSLNNNPNYLSYAKNVMISALLNADLNTYYNFYILMDKEDPILEENKKSLASLTYISPYKIEYRFLPTEKLKKHKAFDDITTRLLFGRFMVEDIFPELDSIISLDVDIIVLRDLYKLQHQENLNQYILAATSEGYKVQDKRLCNFPYAYINAGVMVQNLKKMREIKNTELILSKYKQMQEELSGRCLYSLDQDVMNILYEDQIKFISKRWDYIPAYNFSTKFMPFIIHFAGIKPWVYRNLSDDLKILNDQYSQISFISK